LAAIRPKHIKIKSRSHNLASVNNMESAFPARVWEEVHQNVADPHLANRIAQVECEQIATASDL